MIISGQISVLKKEKNNNLIFTHRKLKIQLFQAFFFFFFKKRKAVTEVAGRFFCPCVTEENSFLSV